MTLYVNEPIKPFQWERNDDITDVIIDVPHVEAGTFSGCRNLKSVKFANEYITISEIAFENCFSLEEIILPQKLENIPEYTFSHCESLKNIKLPSVLKSIQFSAFANTGLEEIAFPETLNFIDSKAFVSCNLKKVAIPDIEILENAFANNTKLETVVMPRILHYTNYYFCLCNNIKTIYLPSKIDCSNICTCFPHSDTTIGIINETEKNISEKEDILYMANILPNNLQFLKTLEDLLDEGMNLKDANDYLRAQKEDMCLR